jgi:hypothetical protein
MHEDSEFSEPGVGNDKRIIFFSKTVVVKLLNSLMWPDLELSAQAQWPHLRKDIEFIEGVQCRAMKLVSSLSNKNYEDRLRVLNLTALETRRLRGDLIEVLKVFKGIDNMVAQKFFELSIMLPSGYSLKLVKHWCHFDCRKFSLPLRVVNTSNSLNEELIACDTVKSFKSKLNEFFERLRIHISH